MDGNYFILDNRDIFQFDTGPSFLFNGTPTDNGIVTVSNGTNTEDVRVRSVAEPHPGAAEHAGRRGDCRAGQPVAQRLRRPVGQCDQRRRHLGRAGGTRTVRAYSAPFPGSRVSLEGATTLTTMIGMAGVVLEGAQWSGPDPASGRRLANPRRRQLRDPHRRRGRPRVADVRVRQRLHALDPAAVHADDSGDGRPRDYQRRELRRAVHGPRHEPDHQRDLPLRSERHHRRRRCQPGDDRLPHDGHVPGHRPERVHGPGQCHAGRGGQSGRGVEAGPQPVRPGRVFGQHEDRTC